MSRLRDKVVSAWRGWHFSDLLMAQPSMFCHNWRQNLKMLHSNFFFVLLSSSDKGIGKWRENFEQFQDVNAHTVWGNLEREGEEEEERV